MKSELSVNQSEWPFFVVDQFIHVIKLIANQLILITVMIGVFQNWMIWPLNFILLLISLFSVKGKRVITYEGERTVQSIVQFAEKADR